MTTPATFVCCGCRLTYSVMSPCGNELFLLCPVPQCRRVVWSRTGDNGLTTFATDQAPDLAGGARFVIDQYRLLDLEAPDSDEVLAGPADQLRIMAADLNADPPHDDAELVHRVKDLIMAARPGCTFQPGRRLVLAGRRSA